MAKKKRRGSSQTGVDPNEARRQRLEARREAKAAALLEQEKKARREKLVRRVVFLGLAAVIIWFLFLRTSVPDQIGGHTIEHFSTAGANQHTDATVSYPMSPPVSGEHAQQPTACGIYSESIPNETFVHNLEHGTVGLLYQPSLQASSIKALEDIAGGYDDHVISMPFADMETPIAIVAWANTMRLTEVDEAAITEFIDVFAAGAQAPEASQDCNNTEDSPFQADSQSTPQPEQTGAGLNSDLRDASPIPDPRTSSGG
jgi:hypothetical protein